MRKNLLLVAILALFFGCSDEKQKSSETNSTQTPKITIKSGNAVKNDDNFIAYDMDGVRKVDWTLNNQNDDTTKQIVAHSRTKQPLETINLALIKKTLSRNFIVKCSACHNDYANGIIGPSLLEKTDTQIADMIRKYKLKQKPNVLMKELVANMSDDEINALASEIFEFNKQLRQKQ